MSDPEKEASLEEFTAQLQKERGYRFSIIYIKDFAIECVRLGRPVTLEVDPETGLPKVVVDGRTSNDILYIIALGAMILGVCFILGGVALVYLGGTGSTTFTLFGNTFTSQNVGVASIFCGAVLAVLTFRRVVKGVERTSR